MRFALSPIIALTLTAAALTPSHEARQRPAPPPAEPVAARPTLPESAPAQAFSYYRDKRLRYSGGVDPVAAYATARRELAALPRHSLAGGSPHPLAPESSEPLAPWESLGPGNIGGRSRALVIHPSRPRIMYAAGVSGGVWKSTNGGRSWRAQTDAMANLSVNALAMSPADPDTLYAGTGEGYFREAVRGTGLPLRGAGIFKTVDGGASWEHLPATSGAAFRWVNDLVVSHGDPLRVYAATRRGVYRSLDGGRNWDRVLATGVRGGCLDLEIRRDSAEDFVFAACGTLAPGTVYRNVAAQGDGAWERVLAEPGMGRTSIATAPSRPQTVYALAASNQPGVFEQGLHGIYRSDESGAPGTWRLQLDSTSPDKLSTLLLSNAILDFFDECGFAGGNTVFNMGWYTNTLAVDPTDPEVVWVGGVDLFRSDDGGRTFGLASYWWIGREHPAYLHADQHRLVFHPRYNGASNQRLFVLNDGGVYRTTNARAAVAPGTEGACALLPVPSWTNLNNGYEVTQFYHGTVFPDGLRFMGGTQDNGTVSRSEAASADAWDRMLGGDGGYSVIDAETPNVVYATTQGGRVYRSTRGAMSGPDDFMETVSGIDDLRSDDLRDFRGVARNFLFIAPLIGDPSRGERLWLGGSRLWRTDNRAATWNPASRRLTGKISALAVAVDDSDRVVAGSHKGRIYRQTAATDADGETTWESTRPRPGFVSSLAFDPRDNDIVYATYANFGGGHLWRSVDGGTTFASLGSSGPQRIPNVPVHSVVVDPTDSNRLILGTDLGVLVSTDGGDSWAVETTGFASVVTEWLTVAERNGRPYLYAFTHGRGVWRVPLH